ncbi:hypothetical protein [Hyalangium versicolor]|uniref:hypothetical protein n=1 Tax=Hyalangium versicolor TaxID=2861190 RepID=UPI001CCB0B95|nr:hypothetical protein [Hyalangium versicolor]
MRSQRLLWLFSTVAVLSACSLLSDFDPEGQPCDSQGQCLEDYACVDGKCVSSPGAVPDGGRDGGTDGGTDGGADAGGDGGTDGGADGGRDGGADGGR